MASPLKSPACSLMTGDNWTPAPVVSAGCRRRERRRGIASLCAALATTLTRTDSEALRFRLLDGIRRIVPGARTVAIRDWLVGETRIDPPQQAGLVTFEIPTSDPRRIAILDAVPCPGRQLDDWDLQTLALSSQVGALVLEVESQRLAARQQLGDGEGFVGGAGEQEVHELFHGLGVGEFALRAVALVLGAQRLCFGSPRLRRNAGQPAGHGQQQEQPGNHHRTVAAYELGAAIGQRSGSRRHGFVRQVAAQIVGQGRHRRIALGRGLP